MKNSEKNALFRSDTQKNRCKSTEQPFRETLAKRLHALLCAYPPFNPKDKSPPGKKVTKQKNRNW